MVYLSVIFAQFAGDISSGPEAHLPSWATVALVVATWAGLIALISKFTKDSDFEASLSLYLQGDYRQKWPQLFGAFFEVLFGKKTLSIRGFIRSSIASLLCVIFILYLYSMSGLISRVENAPDLGKIIFLALSINLVADYVSLTETRFILQYAEKYTHPAKQLSVLIIDLIFTGIVIFIAINIYHLFTKQGVIGPGQLIGILSEYSIFFYSTFLTSIWAWLYFASSWLMPIFQTKFIKYITNYRKHPLLAFTLVTSMILGTGTFAIQLIPVDKFDQYICEVFGGEVCLKVQGLTSDDVQKITYFERVCRDDPNVSCLLNNIAQESYNLIELRTIFQTACERKLASACSLEADLYAARPEQFGKDLADARDLYNLACDGGFMPGCYVLGMMYREGKGAPRDQVQARRLYERVCKSGYILACYNLAFMHAEGEGGPHDYAEARRLYKLACEGNSLPSCRNLGLMYYSGKGVTQDYIEAKRLFKLSCDGGLINGCDDIGLMYYTGKGVPKDYVEAKRLYRQSCDGGLIVSCLKLGSMFSEGEGGSQDYAEARSLYEFACDGGLPIACFSLAEMYSQGKGGAKDDIKASRIIQLTCNQKVSHVLCEKFR